MRPIFLILLVISSCIELNAAIRYVKPVASGLGDGSSWSNASADLQGMINASSLGDEVWVATGMYLPTLSPSGNPSPADPRERTFLIKSGVRVYGSFAGTEATISARNIAANPTTLNGDLGVINNITDNAYHVVLLAFNTNNTPGATFDGFRITNGNATGTAHTIVNGNNIPQYRGGGIAIIRGSGNILRHLKIYNNAADTSSGGIYADSSDCFFVKDSIYNNNAAKTAGVHINGGICSADSCTIYGNNNGGFLALALSCTISNSSIFYNSSGSGGGINAQADYLAIVGNLIYSNSAWDGGGCYIDGGLGSRVVGNAIFNNTSEAGGGVYNRNGDIYYANNTIVNNIGSYGSGGIQIASGSPTISNNIFRGNIRASSTTYTGADYFGPFNDSFRNNMLQNPPGSYTISGNPTGNIFVHNPMFVNSAQPLGADGIPRTADDGLALTACSPAINAGLTPATLIPADILGNGRIGGYDMGAYEFQGTPFAVTPVDTINGNTSVCVNTAIALTNSVPGGVWSSSNTAVATISSTGVVTGVAIGTATIYYTHGNTACPNTIAAKVITVVPVPVVAAITGNDSVCSGSTIILSNSTPGGTWSSNNPSVATASWGVINGIATGNAVISYTVNNGCSVSSTKTVKVNPTPTVANITGSTSLCKNNIAQYNNPTQGGVWSTVSNGTVASISASGLLTANGAGTETVKYTVTNSQGCAAVASYSVAINAPQVTPITGADSLCAGATFQYIHATTAGTWSNFNTAVGTVSSTGSYTSLIAGIDTLYYQYSSNGCPAQVKKAVVVKASPGTPVINGGTSVCNGAVLQLTPSITGGVWSSSSNGVATVDASGLVTGTGTGTANITYTVTNTLGCSRSSIHSVTAHPLPWPATISGGTSVCKGATLQLIPSAAGGTWTSSNNAIAPVNSAGEVTGVIAGTITIAYILTTTQGCSDTFTHLVTVNETIASATQAGATLTAIGQPGATFQWIDCSNNQPIAGETNTTYTATANGQYAVIVTYAGCSDTSNCLTVTGVGIGGDKTINPIIISPNPTNDFVSINTGNKVATSIKLYDVVGKMIKELTPANILTVVDVHDIARGVYHLHVNFGEEVVEHRLVVQ